ncbi:MAG: tRNA (adenosine(37)-N6)-dimethylallyltransferase MiaA [candidate division WOR-3 bacterium]
MKKEVITLIGPTASGKTSICLELGKEFPIEVISADSRQIYKEMDIGTGKVSEEERKIVPHHLIDIKNPDEIYSVYEFLCDCRKKIEEIRKRKKVPIICGGTIFYIKGMLNGMFPEPLIPYEVRKGVREEIEKKGTLKMYEELQKIDPDSARRIHPNDKQRIARAIEVYRASGFTLTQLWKKGNQNRIPLCLFSILPSKKELKGRIEKRVRMMFKEGFVEEVRRLLKKGYSPNFYSFTSLGYKEVAEYILNGNNKNLEEIIRKVIKETKEYANRQITFIKSLPGVKIYDDSEKLKKDIIREIEKQKEN